MAGLLSSLSVSGSGFNRSLDGEGVMTFFDSLWNLDQEQQLNELRGRVDQIRLEHDLSAGDPRQLEKLVEENLELKLRLGLLVRLLISKGVITAQEYAALIAEVRPKS
jgi:hypothetical protein